MHASTQHRSIRRHAAAAALVWSVVVVVSFVLYAKLAHQGVVSLAAAQARASLQKDLAYRRWVAERGGVYVPMDERTPPNPHLRDPERDIVTPGGRPLTLVNPAYMARQVFEEERRRGGSASRITSAEPVRAENAPDPWEVEALARLRAGEAEVAEVGEDPPLLRYMAPLVAAESCRRCHPGVRLGELRGGLSIAVPMTEYFAVADAQILRVGAVHAVGWALGVLAITLAASRASRRVRHRERDRAAREQLEHELAHARRLEALGRLAGGVAHDLNNLLSPILGNAALALERAPSGELRQDLEEILEAAQRARVLTQQLLAFGRKQLLSLEPIDPSEAVEATVPMVRRLVGEAIEVRVELARGLPAVRADRAQLAAALLNLAANARDAMPSGGLLRFATAPAQVDDDRAARLGIAAGSYVALTVADTGVGIDDATRARIFEPFFTTKPAGNGLGLASAHGTFRQLGGAVEVESAPGRGATFRILLPAVRDAPILTPAPPPPVAAPRGTETVLLAEDEPAVRRYAVSVLTGLGYRVLAAAGGDEALALARAHAGELHALVSDLRMPRVGGPELRARLVAERPAVVTVFITGYAGDALGPEAAAAAGAVVVSKPFTPLDLAVALRRALDRQGSPSAPSRSCASSHSE